MEMAGGFKWLLWVSSVRKPDGICSDFTSSVNFHQSKLVWIPVFQSDLTCAFPLCSHNSQTHVCSHYPLSCPECYWNQLGKEQRVKPRQRSHGPSSSPWRLILGDSWQRQSTERDTLWSVISSRLQAPKHVANCVIYRQYSHDSDSQWSLWGHRLKDLYTALQCIRQTIRHVINGCFWRQDPELCSFYVEKLNRVLVYKYFQCLQGQRCSLPWGIITVLLCIAGIPESRVPACLC